MTYRSTSSAASALGACSPAKPAGTASTDILIASVYGYLPPSSLPLTAPGWTLVASRDDAQYPLLVYWAKGDVTATSFTAVGSGAAFTVRVDAFSGLSATSPIRASSLVAGVEGTAAMATAALAATAGDTLYALWADEQADNNFGPQPAGLTDTVAVAGVDAAAYPSIMSYKDGLTAGVQATYSRTVANPWTSRTVVTLVLAASGGGGGDPTVTSTSSASNTEGSAVVHTVTLSAATTASTSYPATLAGVTATAGADFVSTLAGATFSNGVTFSGGNLVVPSGVSSFTVSIPTTDDALNEAAETYTLTVGGVSGTGTILDNDPLPSLSVSDATQSGGSVTFTVTLSAASGRTVTVDYATQDGSVSAGVAYTAKSGTLTFAPGEVSKTVAVTVL